MIPPHLASPKAGNSSPTFSLHSRLCAFDSRPTDRRQTEPTSRRSSSYFAVRIYPLSRRLLTFADRIASRYRLKCTHQQTCNLDGPSASPRCNSSSSPSRLLGSSGSRPRFTLLSSFRFRTHIRRPTVYVTIAWQNRINDH